MKMLASLAILKSIEDHGVDVIYGYPGAANTPIYDSIGKSNISYILTRNEQGAAHAASSYFKMTGKVGVCTATSGPGATNLVTGIANAYMDSIPMVVITGQVISTQVGKDAFQEVDITGVTTPISKHNYLVKNASDIPRILNEAFYIAGTGRPGPVVIDIPMDLQKQEIEYTTLDKPKIRGYRPDIEVDDDQITLIAEMLKNAERPLIVAGGGILLSGAAQEFRALVEKIGIPVVNTLNGITVLPSRHEQLLGMIGSHGVKSANTAIMKSDCIIFFGARVSDRAVANPLSLTKHAKIVHVDIDPAEINKNILVDIHVIGNIKEIVTKLNQQWGNCKVSSEWLAKAQSFKELNTLPTCEEKGFVNPKYFLKQLSEATKGDAIITTEVGQHQIWTANNYAFTKPNTLLTSGGFGTMGYGLPAAMGAKVAKPDALVIAIEGDGSFQMAMPELGALKQWDIDIKIVLFVNRALGMVREYQLVNYNGNYQSIELGAYPHFDLIAKAYEIPTKRISKNSEIDDAIAQMLSTEGSFLLEVLVDPAERTL